MCIRDSLHGVSQDGGLVPPPRKLLAFAQDQHVPKAKLLGRGVQRLLPDDQRPQAGHLSLGKGFHLKKLVADDQLEYRVSQVLQTLVIMKLIAVKAAVGQCPLQGLHIGKTVSQLFLQPLVSFLRHMRLPTPNSIGMMAQALFRGGNRLLLGFALLHRRPNGTYHVLLYHIGRLEDRYGKSLGIAAAMALHHRGVDP